MAKQATAQEYDGWLNRQEIICPQSGPTERVIACVDELLDRQLDEQQTLIAFTDYRLYQQRLIKLEESGCSGDGPSAQEAQDAGIERGLR